ncbi:MAG: hypothetical protein LBB58_02555 [Cellulomonadaceae bacterium]|jgi:hypothetical protein|nr:hypothetical protein [Cellulomonadaceae bacterium]
MSYFNPDGAAFSPNTAPFNPYAGAFNPNTNYGNPGATNFNQNIGGVEVEAVLTSLRSATQAHEHAQATSARAAALGWEAPAATLYRNWLATLAAQVSGQAGELQSQQRAIIALQ